MKISRGQFYLGKVGHTQKKGCFPVGKKSLLPMGKLAIGHSYWILWVKRIRAGGGEQNLK